MPYLLFCNIEENPSFIILFLSSLFFFEFQIFCNYPIRSSEKFLSFYKEIMDAQHFSFCIIAYDPFCSIKIKITTFDRLGFMFV